MSQNPSFIRTDKAIMQALIELLKEKPFEKITVQDILDRTPVTRATFYAHYHDKYEIAERMQEQFFQLRQNIRFQLADLPSSKLNNVVKKFSSSHQEMIEALLKIHTEKVDLRQALVDEYKDYYQNTTYHTNVLTESQVYAQARAEFDLSFIYDDKTIYSFEASNELMMAVSLKLLRLDDDEEVWNFLRKKLTQKFPVN